MEKDDIIENKTENPELKTRSVITATLLSFLMPGLGQVYNGQLLRGMIFFFILGIFYTLWSYSFVYFGIQLFIIGIVIILSFGFFILYDAFRFSRKVRGINLRPYNRWYFYVLLFIIMFIVRDLNNELFVRYKAFRVPTGAMKQTIIPGDHIWADKYAYGLTIPILNLNLFQSSVKRGDIVVFPYPEDPSLDFIKRVIGIGGDQLTLSGESVYINDEIEKDNYLFFDKTLPYRSIKRTIFVPQGKLFVIGDNRRNSKDSRFWGFLDESEVKGKAITIYWSHDPQASLFDGYSWERIGITFD